MSLTHNSTPAREEQLWQDIGLKNIKPESLRFGEYPEGWNVINEINRIITPFIDKTILEIGCGYGRICEAFSPQQYIGVDINPLAIEKARALFPEYNFQCTQYVDHYPSTDIVIAYTVFLHLADETIHQMISTFSKKVEKIIIAEIIGKENWDENFTANYDKPDRLHSVFKRSAEEYETIMDTHGFYLYEEIKKPYYYYKNSKISFLVFQKKPSPPITLNIEKNLSDPHLKYSGIYDDGWTDSQFSLTLTNVSNKSHLLIKGMYPKITNSQPNAKLTVTHTQTVIFQTELQPGQIDLCSSATFSEGEYELSIQLDPELKLPAPDTRSVGFLLKEIGFK